MFFLFFREQWTLFHWKPRMALAGFADSQSKEADFASQSHNFQFSIFPSKHHDHVVVDSLSRFSFSCVACPRVPFAEHSLRCWKRGSCTLLSCSIWREASIAISRYILKHSERKRGHSLQYCARSHLNLLCSCSVAHSLSHRQSLVPLVHFSSIRSSRALKMIEKEEEESNPEEPTSTVSIVL